MDGDGVTDAIRSGTRLECFCNDPVQGWNGIRYLERRALAEFPNILPRRVKRDALRALRGSILHTESYALDGSERQDRPYTVTESLYGVREEAQPGPGDGDRLHIFFPHLLAQRTTQWERGHDPMTQFTFTEDYDQYGQPRSQSDIAVPRGRDYRVNDSPGTPYLATQTITQYAHTAYELMLTDLTGAVYDGKILRKTAPMGWNNSGAASVNRLEAGEDGWVEASTSTPGLRAFFGLSAVNADHHYQHYASGLLDTTLYRTSVTYDALNRVRTIRYPEDVDGQRKELRSRYSRAGVLERIDLDGATFVERLAYNAKGQRILIAYGNGVMTRYAYDPQTFRLTRLRTERYEKQGGAEVRHRPTAPDHSLQDCAYTCDLVGNILTITDRSPGSGVLNNPEAILITDPVLAQLLVAGDALVRRFTYDPLSRLRSATGRECDLPPDPPPWDDRPRCADLNRTRNYTERYQYDAVGNLVFEGMGVDASWELQMPKAANPFDYRTIADVLLTIEYTALHSFTYRQHVIQRLDRGLSADRLFSLRHEFADQWYDLHNPERTATPLVVRFETRREDFPPNIEDVNIQQVVFYVVRAHGAAFELPVAHLHFTEDSSDEAVGDEATTVDGVISTRRSNGSSWLPMTGAKQPFGTWELAFPDTPEVRDRLQNDAIEDLLLVITYQGRTPAWPV